jgi:capsular polysaccharide biosynthesis protein
MLPAGSPATRLSDSTERHESNTPGNAVRLPQKHNLGENPAPAALRIVQPAPTAAAGPEFDVLESVRRRWFLAAVIFIACVGPGGYFVETHMKPTYQADTTIYVSPRLLKNSADQINDLSYLTLVNQQILTILHYDTLSRAIHLMGSEGRPWRSANESEQEAVDRLRASITPQRIPDTYEILLSAIASDAQMAARAANAVANAYLDKGSGMDAAEKARRIASLRNEKSAIEQDLNRNLNSATALSGTLQVANLERIERLPDDVVMAEMRTAYTAAHNKRVEVEQQLAALQDSNEIADAEQLLADPATRTLLMNLPKQQTDSISPGTPPKAPRVAAAQTENSSAIAAITQELVQLNHEITQKESALAILELYQTERHPEVVDARTSLATLKKRREQLGRSLAELNRRADQLAEETVPATDNKQQSISPEQLKKVAGHQKRSLQTQLEQARLTESALGRDVADYAANLQQTSRELHRAQSINGDVERMRIHLRNIQDQIEMLSSQGDLQGFVRIFSAAQAPLQPTKNRAGKLLAALVIFALISSIGIPAGLDALDPHVHNPSSIERILGFPPVGMTIAPSPAAKDFAEEQMRRLITGIERGIARGARSLVLTPLTPLASDALAEAIACGLTERGYRIIQTKAGRQRLRLNSFDRIPDCRESNTYETCSAAKEGGQEYDLAIVAAPPLLMSSEAELLASEADLTLIVAWAGKSTRDDVQRAAQLLERLNVPAVGAILYDVRIPQAGRALRKEYKNYLEFRTSLV